MPASIACPAKRAGLAATVLALALSAPAAAGPGGGPGGGPAAGASPAVPRLDCTFFESQAFNRPAEHFTARMDRVCRMLDAYRMAVIAANRRRFAAETAEPGPPVRIREYPAATDSGKFLIAREIGLIDALAAMAPEHPPTPAGTSAED